MTFWLRNATNAPAVISGVGMLQHLLHATPRGIYWGFISARVLWTKSRAKLQLLQAVDRGNSVALASTNFRGFGPHALGMS